MNVSITDVHLIEGADMDPTDLPDDRPDALAEIAAASRVLRAHGCPGAMRFMFPIWLAFDEHGRAWPMTDRQLADLLATTHGNVRMHLKRLRDTGLLETVIVNGARMWRRGPALRHRSESPPSNVLRLPPVPGPVGDVALPIRGDDRRVSALVMAAAGIDKCGPMLDYLLARMADADGTVTVSTSELAAIFGVKPATAKRYVRLLRLAGLIETITPNDGSTPTRTRGPRLRNVSPS